MSIQKSTQKRFSTTVKRSLRLTLEEDDSLLTKSIGLGREKSASVAEAELGDERWIVSNAATTRMTPATECVFDCVNCDPRIARAAGDTEVHPNVY